MATEKLFTNATGSPVGDNTNIMTAGPRGPALLQDIWLMEKMAHFDGEVIPGAADACKRLRRLRHLHRDTRHHPLHPLHENLQQGRQALFRDPLRFPDLNHAIKRDPRTGLRSADNSWDFWTLLPEPLHQVTTVMSDRGSRRASATCSLPRIAKAMAATC